MRIRLTKPIAQNGRVVPAGVILTDAPPAFMKKLLLQNRAELVVDGNGSEALPVPHPIKDRAKPAHEDAAATRPVATAQKARKTRKAVKADD